MAGRQGEAGDLEELVMENQLESDQIPLTLSWLESHTPRLNSMDVSPVGGGFPAANKQALTGAPPPSIGPFGKL